MIPVAHLSLGGNVGLVRADCITCKSETMHKYGRCIHCDTKHSGITTTRMSGRAYHRTAPAVSRARGLKAMRK